VAYITGDDSRDFGSVDVRSSALKHGLSPQRIRHAIAVCRLPLVNPQSDSQMLFLGPDQYGNPLEVIGVIDRNDVLVVLHAMPLRSAYRQLYAEVNGHH
jgi:hypothetical protein